ncbi:MAG: hypothetical protein KAS04_04815 [Candidatus Aenigmarchaeota archaeon]|nr:hypothetical protein [Candidatus Aenigmarchaeota archaeon]
MSKKIKGFFDDQEGIYKKFSGKMNEAIKEGLLPDPVLLGRKGGYIIALSPHKDVVSALSVLSQKIRKIVPNAVVYGRDQIHTTFSDHMNEDGFDPKNDFKHRQKLNALNGVVKKVFSNRSAGACCYEGCVFDRTTLIVKGIPSKEFVTAAEAVVKEAEKNNIELRMPWGAHITLVRFDREYPSEISEKLKEICISWNPPVGYFTWESVFAGWYTAKKNSFQLYKA